MTTKTKDEGRFTPEPWHQHGLHIHARYESATGVRHYAVVDALSHEGMARGEAEANARLIAAAPDLYAACKAMRCHSDTCQFILITDREVPFPCNCGYALAKAALAKVEAL